MNQIEKIITALRFVANHPMNRGRKFRSVVEYGFIQVAARMVPGYVCVEYPNRTRLMVSPKMKGAAHFIAPRLNEFDDMAFVMHFLRPDELFVDVGANIGAFTILAAGVARARAISFEPSPETFEMLSRNIGLNGLHERVRAVNAVVGRERGTAQFSIGLGTENHVAATADIDTSRNTHMTALDDELVDNPPALLKVDVEGFETEVFAGATKTLEDSRMQAMIVESAGSGNRYGYDEEKLHARIISKGFVAYCYSPFERRLRPRPDNYNGNLIYVRDINSASERLRTAQNFEIAGLKV